MAGVEQEPIVTARRAERIDEAGPESEPAPSALPGQGPDPAEQTEPAFAQAQDTARRSDAGSWARPVARLATADGQAPLDTVRGRRAVGALQGFGRLWQKNYRATIGHGFAARDVVAYWKEHFGELWPKGNAFYAPLTGIAPGEVALLQVGVAGPLRLSTGVVVIYADDESFTFMTPEGHMFAGWITFSAADAPGGAIAKVDVLIRAQSPFTELGLTFGGHRQEDRFWQQTLRNLAGRFGVAEPEVETQVLCVDRRRQWRRAGNIRHDASFKSALFTAAAPLRWARRSIGRR